MGRKKKEETKEVEKKGLVVKLDRGGAVTLSGLPFIDTWRAEGEDEIVKWSESSIYIEFDKIFGLDDMRLNNFDLTKKWAYITSEKKADKPSGFDTRPMNKGESKFPKERVIVLICRYINYLIKFYDTEGVILTGLLHIKYLIHRYPGMSEATFKTLIRERLLTDEVIDMIVRMTEDNYQLNLEKESRAKEKKEKAKYHEKIKITDKHAKIMYSISTAIKLTAPLMTQYLRINHTVEVDPFLTNVEVGYFKYFQKDVNLYMKLFIYSESKLNELKPNNRTSIKKREKEEGKTIDTDFTEAILQRMIHGNFIKFAFNGNLVMLAHSILKNQATTALTREKPNKATFIVENSADCGGEDEPMSAIDKIEIHMSKVDEGNIIKSKKNIEYVINSLKERFNVNISKEEFNYYKDRLIFSPTQRELMNIFYARRFKDSKEILNINKEQDIELAIMLKKYLLSLGYKILPYCILSNITERTGRAVRINKSMQTELKKLNNYNNLIFLYRGILSEEEILSKLGEYINKKYSVLDFEHQDIIEDPAEFDNFKLIQEVIDIFQL